MRSHCCVAYIKLGAIKVRLLICFISLHERGEGKEEEWVVVGIGWRWVRGEGGGEGGMGGKGLGLLGVRVAEEE